MTSNLYKRYIRSSETDLDAQSRATVLNWLLIGALALTFITFLSTLSNVILSNDTYIALRLTIITLLFLCFLGLYTLGRRPRYRKLVGIILVSLFCLIGTAVAYVWGIFVPIGLLIMSMSIVMAGILISARASLYVSVYIVAALTFLEYARSTNLIHPNFSWMNEKPTLGDVVGFGTIYFIIALVSWLFNRQMEHSLQRAQRSEAALKRQKAMLEIRVEERTRELEKLQLEKMQQFYRFAELGRLSTSLFHDLANHLTTMNMDIEGLGKNDESKIMQRIQQNANYIDDVIRRVREQLLGKEESEAFIVHKEVKELIKILTPKAKQTNVRLVYQTAETNKQAVLHGSLTRFRQMIINLLSNAIDSYEGLDLSEKAVTISIAQNKSSIAIVVKDEGCGIAPEIQQNIFKPFYSTKHSGVGIGLFIVKQITEQYFNGTLTFISSENIGTTFTIKIPKNTNAPSGKH